MSKAAVKREGPGDYAGSLEPFDKVLSLGEAEILATGLVTI